MEVSREIREGQEVLQIRGESDEEADDDMESSDEFKSCED